MGETTSATRFQRVRTEDDVAEVVALADEIWNEHFRAIIGEAQVVYMLQKFQSSGAIAGQMRDDGYEYYVVGSPDTRSGYFAIVADAAAQALQLSKLYLRRGSRGRGLGRQIVHWLEAECDRRKLRELWLTVNKDNTDSIAFYEAMGFGIKEATVFDIGEGFIMDDYVMTKSMRVA